MQQAVIDDVKERVAELRKRLSYRASLPNDTNHSLTELLIHAGVHDHKEEVIALAQLLDDLLRAITDER